MNMDSYYEKVHELAIIPVVVLDDVADAKPLADALVAGGMPSAEVTFRTACAADVIRAMRAAQPQMAVGAGTVLSVEQVDEAIEAGAEFIVSPGFDADVVRHCQERGVPVFPACVTPTEIICARKLGIVVTKFFPAAQYGGLATINALSAPFVGHRFMPTGGVSASNVAEFLSNPHVIACGGTWMVKADLIRQGRFDEVERLAREAMEIAHSVR